MRVGNPIDDETHNRAVRLAGAILGAYPGRFSRDDVLFYAVHLELHWSAALEAALCLVVNAWRDEPPSAGQFVSRAREYGRSLPDETLADDSELDNGMN